MASKHFDQDRYVAVIAVGAQAKTAKQIEVLLRVKTLGRPKLHCVELGPHDEEK